MDFYRLVDLVLCFLDVGVVNFNYFYFFFYVILNYIGLSYDLQNGVLNIQLVVVFDEGNDKGILFEQLNGLGKEIFDVDNFNCDDNCLVQIIIQLD